MRRLLLAFFAVAISSFGLKLAADELRPGYLEIKEAEKDYFQVFWKVPAKAETLRLSLYLQFSEDISILGEPVSGFVGNAHTQRLQIHKAGGLEGSSVHIDGLKTTLTDVLLRVEYADGRLITHRLSPASPGYVFEAQPGHAQLAWTYFYLGVEHILMGNDHLLFVLALMLIVVGWGRLLGTITAFTLAHSITLAFAALGFIRISLPPVEAVIALSIVFVAAEIIRGRQGKPGLTAKWPWSVAFIFGLLHGFGFAGALGEIGLPQTAIPLALLTFNLGVEAGQILFVLAMLMVFWILGKMPFKPSEWALRAPAYVIGCIASFWMIERITAF